MYLYFSKGNDTICVSFGFYLIDFRNSMFASQQSNGCQVTTTYWH